MTLFTAALTFSGSDWLLPASVILVVAGLILFWSYRASAPGPLRWVCLSLKAAGLIGLALCLLEPHWTGQRARPGANLFALMADNSQSLQIRDRGETRSRGEILQEVIDPSRTDWQATLSDNFELRRYHFDGRVQPTSDFSGLTFDGRSSSLGFALKNVSERFQGRPIAGIMMLTDGNSTDLRGQLPDLSGLPPVYPVLVGRSDRVRDLAIRQVQVSQSAFEDAPVSIQADVSAVGYNGRPVVARLIDRAGRVVQEQTMDARADGEIMAFRFQLKPDEPGLSFYQVSVAVREAQGEVAADEATLVNNQRVLAVNRNKGPYRVLYVSGRPNWEFKYLNRAIMEDREIELVSLIRVAKREPRFDFRGRSGESSNPLFRGFGNQSAEDIERYDQPVLVRLNTRDELELSSGYPRTPEDLYNYHAIIVDDLEAEFFAPDQALLTQKFVSERGGGFMMLSGMESFQEGGYHRTPVGDMLPVYLDRTADPYPSGMVHWQLDREGWLQPWARIRDNEADERARQEEIPSFGVINRVRGIKPGASVIATARDVDGTDLPALVVQRFGRGRTAGLTIGDIWRWGMQSVEAREDMDKAWRQWVRWLVADVPERVDLTIEPVEGDANGAVVVQARVRDPRFLPLDDASVMMEIEPVVIGSSGTDTGALRLQAEPSLSESGLYELTFVPRLTGGYKASAVVTNAVGAEVGRAEAGWSTDLAAEEFHSLAPNLPLMEEIARRTGGEVIDISRLNAFVRDLPSRNVPVMETWSYPIWHTPAVLLFAFACLLAEWGLRRWKGLP